MAIKDRVLSIKISSQLYNEYSTLADKEGTSLADFTRSSLEFKKQYGSLANKLNDMITQVSGIQNETRKILEKEDTRRAEAMKEIEQLRKEIKKKNMAVLKAARVLDEDDQDKFAEAFKKELSLINGKLGA